MTFKKDPNMAILAISTSLLLIILLFITSCNQGEPYPNFFVYKVLLETKDTNEPIKNVKVNLDIPGSKIILTEYTDNDGFVLFNIQNQFENEIANLTVLSDDYISEIHKITLLRDTRSKRLLLEIAEANIAVIQTPIPSTQIATTPTRPPTQLPTDSPSLDSTPLPTLTNTSTAIATDIPTDTPTIRPSATPSSTPNSTTGDTIKEVEIITTLSQQEVYLGPSRTSGVYALLHPGSNAVALLRTTDSQWYYVRLNNGKEGWVEAKSITLIDGDNNNLAVDTVIVSPTPPSQTTTPKPLPSNCLSTWVEKTGINNDDIRIFWNTTYPQNTGYLILQVIGKTASGSWREQPLIENNTLNINDVDTVENGFLIGGWKFDAEGFPENNLFQYDLSAHAQDGTWICTTTNQFTK